VFALVQNASSLFIFALVHFYYITFMNCTISLYYFTFLCYTSLKKTKGADTMANFKGYSGGNMENIVAEKFRELDSYNNAVHPEYTKNNYELLGRFKSSEEVSEYVYSEFEKVKGIDYYDQPKNMREGDKAVNCIVNLVVNLPQELMDEWTVKDEDKDKPACERDFGEEGRAKIKEFGGHVLDFLKTQPFGEDLLYAQMHMDETTPHVEVGFFPRAKGKKPVLDADGHKIQTGTREIKHKDGSVTVRKTYLQEECDTVSSAKVLSKTYLQDFHKDLDAYMTKVYGVPKLFHNGRTMGNKTLEEYKAMRDQENALDSRENTLNGRERALDRKERELAVTKADSVRTKAKYEAKLEELNKREETLNAKESELEKNALKLKEFTKEANARLEQARGWEQRAQKAEAKAEVLENSAKQHEERAQELENNAKEREAKAEALEKSAKTREMQAGIRESRAKRREENARALENSAKEREAKAETLENNAKQREEKAEKLENNAKTREANAEKLENSAKKREQDVTAREMRVKHRETAVTERENAVNKVVEQLKATYQNAKESLSDVFGRWFHHAKEEEERKKREAVAKTVSNSVDESINTAVNAVSENEPERANKALEDADKLVKDTTEIIIDEGQFETDADRVKEQLKEQLGLDPDQFEMGQSNQRTQ
jgi:hypothetical protein